MTPNADIYPEWTPPCPNEEQDTEKWLEYQEHKELKT